MRRSGQGQGQGGRGGRLGVPVAIWALLALLAPVVLGACRGAAWDESRFESGRPVVVATTTMLADLVREVGGDTVHVESLLAVGSDPHIYQPRPFDARLVARSQLVVVNGLHLEGWIEHLVRYAGGERPVVVASRDVKPITMPGSDEGVDPHFWFDVGSWMLAAEVVREALVELHGPGTPRALAVERQAREHLAELAALDRWVRQSLDTLPPQRRLLATGHDAFNYLGRAYGLRVEGIQGVSTEQEGGQRDVIRVVELVRDSRLPAVFMESSTNPGLVRQVARETGARVAGPLWTDSLGPAAEGADTYVGMMRANVYLIVKELGGRPALWPPLLEPGEAEASGGAL